MSEPFDVEDLTRLAYTLEAARWMTAPVTCRDAAAEIERLRNAIRAHRDERGDDRCWIDDLRLYASLGDGGIDGSKLRLPPKADFLGSCERYWECRQDPLTRGTARLPGDMTIAQLTCEVERLRAENEELRADLGNSVWIGETTKIRTMEEFRDLLGPQVGPTPPGKED